MLQQKLSNRQPTALQGVGLIALILLEGNVTLPIWAAIKEMLA